ncbi:MAG: tRNA (cytidine(34)-2'-O)-methyltransferase [Pseudomonadaceae bacterium]|nr:tRNA (cytidine(34)-2'-O)-methyltransferase [Pseudomonadaceae bacterium]
MAIEIVLHEPEIAPNTGNIIRLAANTGASLHLIEPLGFEMDDKRLRRAGLDYHEFADVRVHKTWLDYLEQRPRDIEIFAFSRHSERSFDKLDMSIDCALLFGSETRGLPDSIKKYLPNDHLVRIPMKANSRSLNLSNSVAIGLYAAWRQQGYAGAV